MPNPLGNQPYTNINIHASLPIDGFSYFKLAPLLLDAQLV